MTSPVAAIVIVISLALVWATGIVLIDILSTVEIRISSKDKPPANPI